MSNIRTAGGDGGTFRSGGGRAAGYLSSGLRFAATPTFAVMALLAGLPGDGGPAEFLCLSADHASPFGGMVPMYLLMCLFHLPPWLRLLAGQDKGGDRADPAAFGPSRPVTTLLRRRHRWRAFESLLFGSSDLASSDCVGNRFRKAESNSPTLDERRFPARHPDCEV